MSQPANILLVDDEPIIRELVREVLEVGGDRLVEASNLAEARQAIADGDGFDVAVIDKNLPDGSGIELIRELRAGPADTAVILITGYPSLDSAIEVLQIGIFDYLVKPFDDISHLGLTVRNALETRRLRREGVRLARDLSESDERYKTLIDAIPDAVLVYDDGGVIHQHNLTAERMYGYTTEELNGARAADLLRSTSDAGTSEMTAAEVTGIARRTDRRKDGSELPVEVRASTTTVGGERLTVEIVRDISERLTAEKARARLEEQLRGSQKLEAIGRLAGGVAHDFNNLLVLILNYVEFVRNAAGELSKQPSDALRDLATSLGDYSDDIADAGHSAVALTQQLLAFSRNQPVSPRVLSPPDVLEKVTRLLRRAVREDINLVVEVADDTPEVLMDRAQLEQLLMNLAVNARDAMPEGGTLTIRGSMVSLSRAQGRKLHLDAGRYACFAVSDTGVGIPDEILAHIYEPFFTTKSGDRGSGLGLATAYSIAQRAGGTVQVTTELTDGTRFDVYIPAHERDANDVREVGDAAPAPRSTAGHGETILVVEDDAGVRRLIRRLLQRAGYATLEASEGAAGLDAFREHKDDIRLVLTDVMMPQLKGSDLVSEIRSIRDDIRVVFMSGYPVGSIIHDSVSSGLAAFLPKPFTGDQLLATVRDALA